MKCVVRACLLTSKSMFSILFPTLQFLLSSIIFIYINAAVMCVVSCLATSALVWDGKPDLQLCCCQDFWSIGSSSQSLSSSGIPHLVPSWPISLIVGFLFTIIIFNFQILTNMVIGHLGLSIITVIEFFDSFKHPGHPTHHGQLDLLGRHLPSWQPRFSWSPWSTLTGRRLSTSPWPSSPASSSPARAYWASF